MNFPRITITSGALVFLLLAAGCAAPEKTGVSSASAPGEEVAVYDVMRTQAPPEKESVREPSPPTSNRDAIPESQAKPQPSQTESHSAPAASKPKPAQTTVKSAPAASEPEQDLWQRLRGNFRLSDHDLNQRRLDYFEKWYSARPKYFERLTERARWFLPFVLEEVEKRGMPGEIALLPAIESAFRLDAVSRSHAVGMWQFISATGRRYGLRQDWWVDGRRGLIQSTRAALDYLDFLQKEFNGDWELALASYNAGEGAVRRRVKDNLKRNKPANYSSLKLRRETTDYVPKLMAVRNIIAEPHKFGITLKPMANAQTLAVVDARSQTDLNVAASLIGIPGKQLRYFNQNYKRGTTPPNGPHLLVVPVEYSAKLHAGLNRIGSEQRLRWARHQVHKGETLSHIALKYGVSVASITDTNGLKSDLIHPRQELRIPLSISRYQYAESAQTNAAGDKVHKVRRGDSLWAISRRYGVSIAELTRWNQIPRNALLHPGQSLVVGR